MYGAEAWGIEVQSVNDFVNKYYLINVHTQIWYTEKRVKYRLVYVLSVELLNNGVD